MLFYFTVCLSLIYAINYFCLFSVLRKYRLHKNTYQCKIFHCTWRRLVWPAEIWYTFKKIILRCVGFCFCILHFICKADQITIDPTYTSRIIVPVACLNILWSVHGSACQGYPWCWQLARSRSLALLCNWAQDRNTGSTDCMFTDVRERIFHTPDLACLYLYRTPSDQLSQNINCCWHSS